MIRYSLTVIFNLPSSSYSGLSDKTSGSVINFSPKMMEKYKSFFFFLGGEGKYCFRSKKRSEYLICGMDMNQTAAVKIHVMSIWRKLKPDLFDVYSEDGRNTIYRIWLRRSAEARVRVGNELFLQSGGDDFCSSIPLRLSAQSFPLSSPISDLQGNTRRAVQVRDNE